MMRPMTFGSARLSMTAFAILTGLTLSPSRSDAKDACPSNLENRGVSLWLSPSTPNEGSAYAIVASSADSDLPKGAGLYVNGALVSQTEGSFWRSAVVEKSSKGTSVLQLRAGSEVLACKVVVAQSARRSPHKEIALPVYWPTKKTWNPNFEAYYAAWIDRLFDAPPETSLGFRPLSQALQDPQRNMLWNHLGLAEDTAKSKSALRIEPDCADLPYMLRAYFSWKMGLPFAVHECDRGTPSRPPVCSTLRSNEDATKSDEPLAAFKSFLILLANKAHSGSLRTAMGDSNNDFYPIPLTRQALRPGTVFADPYGHVLVVARWVDRPDQPGLLYAVDGQPDKSITRKRFWEGNFLFASDVPSAGAGFKAYRPFVSSHPSEDKSISLHDNDSLKNKTPRNFDASQGNMSPDEFYARMFKLINPKGLKAETAYDDTLAALVEQLEARVRSVDNGEVYMKQTRAAIVDMPIGASIFETVGAWEDYATPSRDMRLLIAMQVLLDLPIKLTSHPELFNLNGQTPAQVRSDLESRHQRLTLQNKITYINSAGSPVSLSIADVLQRRKALQAAYNPNDCNELRWGAEPGSDEAKTCSRRAPADQVVRMNSMRAWFAKMRRPTRE
jgi:hypothetical protein